MMQSTAIKWSQRFKSAGSMLSSYQLDQLAGQASELAAKADSGELFVAFCGHFSAGKSTLVNALLGGDVLPSSPIPTTANVVEVRAGEPQAIVTMDSGEQLQFPLENQLESVKRYCVDEPNVKRVSIDYPTHFLPPKVVLLDTPGIDSTDAVHQLATESVLFLSDLVFYMMDYNHVQSELNFLFAKELQNRGKKLYLLVNQIDKHMDFELDFDSYRESVEEAFAGWGVKPQGIFYTSMQEADHPNNQFQELKATLQTLFAEKEAIIEHGLRQESEQLVERARIELLRTQSAAREELSELIGQSTEPMEQVRAQLSQLQGEQHDLEAAQQNQLQQLEDSVLSAIRDARLFTFTTTELGADYLESLAPNFKVGWFTTAGKQRAERDSRLQKLADDLQNQVNSQLVWVVKDLMGGGAQTLAISDEEYLHSVNGLALPIEPEFLAGLVKTGASGRDYVYRYREDVTTAVKERVRHQILQLIPQLVTIVEKRNEKPKQLIEGEITRLKELIDAKENLNELDEQLLEILKNIKEPLGVEQHEIF